MVGPRNCGHYTCGDRSFRNKIALIQGGDMNNENLANDSSRLECDDGRLTWEPPIVETRMVEETALGATGSDDGGLLS